MVRAFLAIDLPEVLRSQLALVQGELKRSAADVRWVPVGNIHLTLKFFGNVPDEEIDPLARVAREVAKDQDPFKLTVTQAGAFPNTRSPRVVWLGMGGDVVPLTQFYYRLEKAFAALGHPPEDRAFNPHLTLGRVRSPKGRERLSKALQELPGLNGPPFLVHEIVLFQSNLSPQGATYTPLKVIPLG